VVKEIVANNPNSKQMMLLSALYVVTESYTKKESLIPNNQFNIKPFESLFISNKIQKNKVKL
jgi:hypothetical protein